MVEAAVAAARRYPQHEEGRWLTEIYVDGDACPVRDEIYRVAARLRLDVLVVSNGSRPIRPILCRSVRRHMPGWWRGHPGRSCFLVRPSRDRRSSRAHVRTNAARARTWSPLCCRRRASDGGRAPIFHKQVPPWAVSTSTPSAVTRTEVASSAMITAPCCRATSARGLT